MSLSDLASLGSFVSGVAVLVMRNGVGSEYAAFIDGLIAATPMRPPLSLEDRLADWKSGWAKLTLTA